MTCEAVNGLLDKLMDGELTEDERAALEAHGRECPACAEAIHATLQMKALFSEMTPEADVPLAAQAKWRNAIKEEAKQRKGRRLTRWVGSAAAAVVVLVGVGLALNGSLAPKQDAARDLATAEYALEAAEADDAYEVNDVAVVGTDGEEAIIVEGEAAVAAPPAAEEYAPDAGAIEEAAALGESAETTYKSAAVMDEIEDFAAEAPVCAAVAQQTPACEWTIQVKDVAVACGVVSDLADEFEGYADVQTVEDGSANVYVEIGAESAADFLAAVSKLDENQASAPTVSGEGTVLVLLVVEPAE